MTDVSWCACMCFFRVACNARLWIFQSSSFTVRTHITDTYGYLDGYCFNFIYLILFAIFNDKHIKYIYIYLLHLKCEKLRIETIYWILKDCSNIFSNGFFLATPNSLCRFFQKKKIKKSADWIFCSDGQQSSKITHNFRISSQFRMKFYYCVLPGDEFSIVNIIFTRL